MGNRLSKIYTRTGDKGETGLGDGGRIAKNHPRMEVIGTVDELNAHVGVLMVELAAGDELAELLTEIQHDLFDIGGELSIPGYTLTTEDRVTMLEDALDRLNEALPPLKNFILPGGNRAAAACHLARTICRRAERCMVTLHETEEINPLAMQYINRLSDLLFVASRVLARRGGNQEVLWRR